MSAAAPRDRREETPRRGLYGALLATVVGCFAVEGAIEPGAVQQVVVSTLLGTSLLLAFEVARASRRMMMLALFIATTGVVVSVLRAATGLVGDGEARAMNALLVLFAPPAVALGVVRNLRRTGEVRLEAVTGVLVFYMLIGLLFAFIYGAIDNLGGEPFFAGGAEATVANCVYFSFTTLTTTGFGDLTARTDFGHTITIFEALTGQIYLVTVVSLIVSNLKRPQRS
jgi:hypothetical protein